MTQSLSLCGTGSQGRLTLRDHVGLCDHVVEEGQHLDHLLVLVGVGQLAGTEGLWVVCLEEAGIQGVDNLSKLASPPERPHFDPTEGGGKLEGTYIEEVLAIDGLLVLIVWKVLSDAAIS